MRHYPMEPITVDTKLEFKEYLEIYNKRFIRFYFYVFIVLIGAILLINMADTFFAICFAFVFLSCVAYNIYYGYKRVRIEFLSYNSLQGTIQYSFTDSQISYVSITSKWNCTWKEILKVEEMKSIIILYTNNNKMFLIPKKSFSQEQLEQFKNMLKTITGLKFNLQ